MLRSCGARGWGRGGEGAAQREQGASQEVTGGLQEILNIHSRGRFHERGDSCSFFAASPPWGRSGAIWCNLVQSTAIWCNVGATWVQRNECFAKHEWTWHRGVADRRNARRARGCWSMAGRMNANGVGKRCLTPRRPRTQRVLKMGRHSPAVEALTAGARFDCPAISFALWADFACDSAFINSNPSFRSRTA